MYSLSKATVLERAQGLFRGSGGITKVIRWLSEVQGFHKSFLETFRCQSTVFKGPVRYLKPREKA